jgi:erythromycin esterase
MRSTYAILFVIFGTALATAQATSPPPVPPIVRWLRANAVRLQTTDPEAPLDDLEPLREIVGDRRLVLLGEPTHGSHEIRLLTHRFIQFLVEHMRFNVVATEIPYPEGLRLNEYVSNGRGITEDILSDLSQEEIHLIHWLRDYNQSALPTAKVHVYGIDIPLVSHPAPPLNYLRRNIPNDLKAFLHKLAPLNEGSVTIPSISAARNGESQYQDALKTLLALFDRYRTTLIQSSSRETWELARHHVVTLQQSHRFSQRLLHWGIGSSPDSLRDLTNEVCVACRSLLVLATHICPMNMHELDRRSDLAG